MLSAKLSIAQILRQRSEPKDLECDDLERKVYCILGLPIVAVGMPELLRRIEVAAASQTAFLISTPNLTFLVQSRSDPEFRESLLDSDLCPADGMPIVWIARLIGVPVTQRVSGSDIFDVLKSEERLARQLKVFLFGGPKGVAAAAAKALNSRPSGLRCVGAMEPGFGTVEQMSQDHIIEQVNASEADFLAVSLGAKKGQLWLHRNHHRLTIPVRSHLGAVINFQAGTVKRAPTRLRAWGLEWVWRIKEEPHLWRRYAHDGTILLYLLFTRVLPLAVLNRWYRLKSDREPEQLLISAEQHHDYVRIKLSGDAKERNIGTAISCFRETLTKEYRCVFIDLTSVRIIDGRFMGLLLMVRKYLKGQGTKLGFIGVSPAMRRWFWLNEVDFLLASADKT
jgi:N-acetylglucosaminyldiphosphoundecaprenol N-acetyl-beta-D-mannosaminyltransferase